MTPRHVDRFYGPGELPALAAERGLTFPPSSPLGTLSAASPGAAPQAAAVPRAEDEPAALDEALRAAATPARLIHGTRSVRRMEPWPFYLARGASGSWVVIAPEGGGAARMRFPLSADEVASWLVGPLRGFESPEVPLAELPPLAPSGIAVFLAMADLLRDRLPEPPGDAAPDFVFGPSEIAATLERGICGEDPSSLVRRLSLLVGLDFSRPSDDEILGILYVFASEGWLSYAEADSTPLFESSPGLTWSLVTLAWWDMSLSLAVGSEPGFRMIQGAAIWTFATEPDGRIRSSILSGAEFVGEIGRICGSRAVDAAPGAAQMAPGPATPRPRFCGHCGTPFSGEARFCGRCGRPIPA